MNPQANAEAGKHCWAVAVCLPAALAGCAATGPAFVAPEPPAPGHAVVYVYRAGSIFGAGVKQEVWVGARPVGKMVNGGYMRVEVIPDNTFVSSPDCRPVGVHVLLEAGDSAYVQVELVSKTFELGGRYYLDYGCRLVQRSEAEAQAVLRGLHMAP